MNLSNTTVGVISALMHAFQGRMAPDGTGSGEVGGGWRLQPPFVVIRLYQAHVHEREDYTDIGVYQWNSSAPHPNQGDL